MTNLKMDPQLDEIRQHFEAVADTLSNDKPYTWCWDDTRMHLTITNAADEPVATLHVAQTQ